MVGQVYYHSLCEGAGNFDAALLGGSRPTDAGWSTPRPAYNVFQGESSKATLGECYRGDGH